mmetsp:Transcript_13108/g.57007  ORF Transcript_13108/g.57007 Transcript_13108/m.57007 type:complete len:650 (+) Transcript_13108:279-2228(+)
MFRVFLIDVLRRRRRASGGRPGAKGERRHRRRRGRGRQSHGRPGRAPPRGAIERHRADGAGSDRGSTRLPVAVVAAAEPRPHGVDGPRLVRSLLLELPAPLHELRDLLVLAVAHRLPRLQHLVQLANLPVSFLNLGSKLRALRLEHQSPRLAALIALPPRVSRRHARPQLLRGALRGAKVVDALLERLLRARLRRLRLRRRCERPPLRFSALLERARELGEPRVRLCHRRLVRRRGRLRLRFDELARLRLVNVGAFGEVGEASRRGVGGDAQRHPLRLGDGREVRGWILRREQRGGELVRGVANLALRRCEPRREFVVPVRPGILRVVRSRGFELVDFGGERGNLELLSLDGPTPRLDDGSHRGESLLHRSLHDSLVHGTLDGTRVGTLGDLLDGRGPRRRRGGGGGGERSSRLRRGYGAALNLLQRLLLRVEHRSKVRARSLVLGQLGRERRVGGRVRASDGTGARVGARVRRDFSRRIFELGAGPAKPRLGRVQLHAELRGVGLELRLPDAAAHELLEEFGGRAGDDRAGPGSAGVELPGREFVGYVLSRRRSVVGGVAGERFGIAAVGGYRGTGETDRERARVRELGERGFEPRAERVRLRLGAPLDVLHLPLDVLDASLRVQHCGVALGGGGRGGIRRGSRARRA